MELGLHMGSLLWEGTGDNCAMGRYWARQGFEAETHRGWVWDGASRCSHAPDSWKVYYRSPETFHEFRFYLGKMAVIKMNQKQGQTNLKTLVQLHISSGKFGSFFNMHSKWHFISRLIPILFQNMKGNLAFKLTFHPKVMFFPLLSFTENIGTPLITVSPQMIILLRFANSAKKSSTYTAFVSLHISGHLKSRGSYSESLPALQPAVPTPGQSQPWLWGPLRAVGSLWKIQTGDDDVSLLPSRGHAMTTVTATWLKIPGFTWRCWAWLSSWIVFSPQK